ncbi:ethanolamine ammonia-lyase subunit EutC [Propionibacteriaceae bacterium Y1923]|uniref:ethanolamine ammonia-lyase subunit EutC n=1 Tax=Aestuariimicrobium sp. Y1814 TaxID=3418742 RepID=UPI003C29B836
MSDKLEDIVARVLAELAKEGISAPAAQSGSSGVGADGDLVIDLPDPTLPEARRALRVVNPVDPDGLRNLAATTSARLGVGRAGARPLTQSLLLFQADHGVTQDAIHGVVDEQVKAPLNLFSVTSQVKDREEYLLRPDLGRKLSEEAKQTIAERCTKNPDVQICVGDGLSAAAIDSNLNDIYPVLEQGLTAAGLSIGTPFFIQNARVGIMNDVNTIVGAKVLLLLIGERPGLGIADAMSVYMGYDPQPGKSDADRDLICMITTNGGTNPLEAGAYVVEVVKRMMQHGASGVKLRELAGQA